MSLRHNSDDYATYLPDELWRSDSYMQHFESAEELNTLQKQLDGPVAENLSYVRQIISTDGALDELGICDLTEGCNFLSMPPDKVMEFSNQFASFRQSPSYGDLTSDTKDWLDQWNAALDFFAAKRLGLIGHAG